MTKIIAHRGASGYAPENTMEAFKLAVEMKADGIETDVHLTKDGEVVIMHDEKIDRTTDGTGYLKDYTYAELMKFNANNHMEQYEFCKIPKLADLLALVKESGILLNIELKTDFIAYPQIEEKVLKLVKEYEVEEQIIYSSFNHYSIAKIKALDVTAKTGLLYMEGLYKPWDYAKSVNAEALHPFYPNLEIPDYVEKCHKNKIMINAWTVNKRADMKHLIDLGIDGVITNYPDIALAYKK